MNRVYSTFPVQGPQIGKITSFLNTQLANNKSTVKQEHSESANLCHRQNLKQKWSRIQIQIFGLIRIWFHADVSRVCPKMLWMHYLVLISYFAKYGTNWLLIVWEMLTNVQNPQFRNGEENEKMIRNPHADPDHHQKVTTSRGSTLAQARHVWSTSVSAFVSYPAYKMTEIMTERQNDHIASALWAELIIISLITFTFCKTIIAENAG